MLTTINRLFRTKFLFVIQSTVLRFASKCDTCCVMAMRLGQWRHYYVKLASLLANDWPIPCHYINDAHCLHSWRYCCCCCRRVASVYRQLVLSDAITAARVADKTVSN